MSGPAAFGSVRRAVRILFVESDDSFSWNVIDALPFAREAIDVVHVRHAPLPAALGSYAALVIGPGPMDPLRVGLVELVHRAAALRLPTLGVCLGHQALGLAFGARLTRVAPVHGKTSRITFGGSRWLAPAGAARTMMRYHSLALEAVASPLVVTARSEDGVVMAIEHDHLPMAGVQFHPDSYASEGGRELLAHFFHTAGVQP